MKYMLLIYGDSTAIGRQANRDTAEAQAQSARWAEVTQRMDGAGVRVAGDALQTPDTATTVRGADAVVSDGPFAETKEVLLGYYLLDVPDLDEALTWARQLPNLPYGSVEVRPIMEVAGA
jgi:hypothetical protein